MRIAVNTRLLVKGKLEGLCWYNYEICRRLVEQHPEDDFLFLFDRPYDDDYIFGPNVTARMLPPPARHPLLWYLWFEWSISFALHRWKADVFLSPDSYCSLQTRVPTVMITHDIAHVHYPEQISKPVRRYYQTYVPRFLDRADRIVAVSDFVRRDIHEHYGISLNKMTVAHNGLRGRFAPVPSNMKEKTRLKYTDGAPYFFTSVLCIPAKSCPG